MSDYASIAGLSWDEVQEPQNLPGGSYLLKLKNVTFQPAKEEGKNPVVLLVHQPKEAMDDVDTEALEALGAQYDIKENKLFTRVYIEDGSSLNTVRRILGKHRVGGELVSMSGDIEETFKSLAKSGAEVIGFVKLGKPYTRADGSQGQNNEVSEWADPQG